MSSSSSSSTQNQQARCLIGIVFCVVLIACVFVGDAMAGGKNKGGGDDIILYNGNIVLRGSGGGKGKGKGGGSIVVANSPQHHELQGGMDMSAFMHPFMFGRRR